MRRLAYAAQYDKVQSSWVFSVEINKQRIYMYSQMTANRKKKIKSLWLPGHQRLAGPHVE